MTDSISSRLEKLGHTLPMPASPAANYLAWIKLGTLVFIAGQVPKGADGKDCFNGKLGAEFDVAAGQKAACLCALNILAQLDAAVAGHIDRVRRCVRLGGFINATPDFAQHPLVLNGASDLIIAVLGEAGRHTRTTVGVGSLPRNIPVEVEAIFEVV